MWRRGMALLTRNPCTRLLVIVMFSFIILIENSSCYWHKNPNSPLENLSGKTSTFCETCSGITAVTIRQDLTPMSPSNSPPTKQELLHSTCNSVHSHNGTLAFQSWNIAVSTPHEGCNFLNVISQHCQLERLYRTNDE